MPNITTNPTAEKAFKTALKQQNWTAALDVLAKSSCTVKPSQAPELREAIRANQITLPHSHRTDDGAMQDFGAHQLLEPDRDEFEAVAVAWQPSLAPFIELYPHYTTNAKASYQVTHHCMMDDPASALVSIARHGVSFTTKDFDGALWRAAQSQPTHVRRDGNRITIVIEQRS
jgi:hypothetical protein